MAIFKNYLERLIEANTAGDAVQGGGGAIAVGVGDYRRWYRSGLFDLTSTNFDYAANGFGSVGSSIIVDSSSEWISTWGYAVPKLVEAGVYFIHLKLTEPSGSTVVGLNILDNTGQNPPPWNASWAFGQYAVAGVPAVIRATFYVAAGTHIEANLSGAENLGNQAALLIQKVG